MLQRMLNRLRGANDDEKGFTLIELLVVILIIGILAAIALPTFLGQQKKAQDSSAKSDARNAVTQVESCIADASDTAATACNTAAANPGLAALGTDVNVGAITMTNGAGSYAIVATSKSGSTYTITKNANGTSSYTTSNTSDTRWAENSSS